MGMNTSVAYNFISFMGINYIIMLNEGIAKTPLLPMGDMTT
jgi:hypothetical protein